MSLVLHEQVGEIAVVYLNRPDKLNALSKELVEKLAALLYGLQDTDTRVVIITGAGDRAFSAGTDINILAKGDPNTAAELSKTGQHLCELIEKFPVPVIAAISGVAAGGGCELALACHLRIASTEARFSLPETKLGLIPAYGGTQRLAKEIGLGRAIELMLTGRTITGEEALKLGLVNRLSSPPDLLDETMSLAKEIAQLSPLSIRACLRAVTEGLELPLNEALKLETELFASLFATEDAREGTSAFLEKRIPKFKGR
jgi:enoyl-CoA hydratase/carnithine racemase